MSLSDRRKDGPKTRLAALLLALTGCASIGQREPVISDQVARFLPVEVLEEGAVVEVKQEGTELSLALSHVCGVRKDRVVNRTTQTEAFNASPQTDWWLLGTALASAGAGLALVVDSRTTYPNDRNSRTYNPTGPQTERLYGFGLIGVGAMFATIAVVDVVRANGSKVERTEQTLPGELDKSGVRCKSRPYANVQVMGSLTRLEFPLGTTGPQGKLDVNLDEAMPQELVLSSSVSKVDLCVNGKVVGGARVEPVLVLREARAFAQSGIDACKEVSTLEACKGVNAFVSKYPDGPHGVEAGAALAALNDNVSWSRLRPEECANGNFAETDPILMACAPLRAYLDQFPEGRHAQEARAALARGEKRAGELNAKLDRAAREAEIGKAAREKSSLSVARVKQILIRESIERYPGPCACPYHAMRNGRACGGRSAWSRPGGFSPLCYPSDVTAEMVQRYRDENP